MRQINFTNLKRGGSNEEIKEDVIGNSAGLGWGLLNYADNYKGIQWSAINYNKSDFLGWQAGLIDYVRESVMGLQSGVVNYAGKLTGLELGLVNW